MNDLDEVTRRVFDLPPADQYELAERLRRFLALERPLLDDEGQLRAQSVADLRAAMAHLNTTRPLTKDEYTAARTALGLGWSWQRIYRLWKSFEVAARVAAGERQSPSTWQQRDFKRRYLAGRPARTAAELVAAVRTWLDAGPFTETSASYDAFARERNLELDAGGTPLPRADTITGRLGLGFGAVITLAKGDGAVDEVIQQKARATSDWTTGPHALVGLHTVERMYGRNRAATLTLARSTDFPRPVLTKGSRRIWLEEEVSAFLAGKPLPLGEANRLQQHYLAADEAAALLGVERKTLVRSKTLPRPCARVANMYFWSREVVAECAARQEQRIATRRWTKPVRKTSQFVTLSSIADELSMNFTQALALSSEPGFPAPAARFGGGGIWLRAAVEAFLNGRPLPAPSSARLVDTPTLREELALKPGVRPHHYADLPPPVVRIKTGNVYLRDEVEASLRSPGAQARLERRRARRARER